MGAAPTGFSARIKANGAGDFLDYCHTLGLGGAELRGEPPLDAEAIRKFRARLESYQMHVIFNVRLPNTDADLPAYEASVKATRECGAYALHAAMTQRRYEEFSSVADYEKSFARNQRQVALAEPVLRRNKVRLAIENHKGWRAVEQAAWMKRVSSEWIGVHFDFGNNVSFCEDPMFTLETLKPWILACHIKDMAVERYEDGFLLSEVPLGDGFLDLKTMVDTLRTQAIFDLEMITRDPLKIPVLTDRYWATFRDVPASQLAAILSLVDKNPPKKPLPRIAGLNFARQLKLEDANNQASIDYARQHLGL
jgi:sugar phosphate isomerase/epimerase